MKAKNKESISRMARDMPDQQLSKEQQILEGARRIFMEHGFSAATTDMVQRAAGVSKATMYAYYPNKELLFAAVVEKQCEDVSNSVSEIPDEGGDLRSALTRVGTSYLRLAASPRVVSLFRTVIAEVPRFPELGRFFYETGPKRAIDLMAIYIETHRMDDLDLPAGIKVRDVAIHFMEILRGDAQMRILSGVIDELGTNELNGIVERAVSTIFRAYAKDRHLGVKMAARKAAGVPRTSDRSRRVKT
jgi:TetR/AcrR family transcriptional regulator, mexJK operon transcriptional repressor